MARIRSISLATFGLIDNTLDIRAVGGKNLFVRQSIKLGVFIGGSALELVSEEEGRKEGRSRMRASRAVRREPASISARTGLGGLHDTVDALKRRRLDFMRPISATADACRRGWVACALCLLVGASNAWSQVRTIDVTRAGDAYVVAVDVFAPVARKVAWDVLTDFPHMARWVPNLKESTVVTPGEKQMTIEQSGTAKFGGVGFSYTSTREIVLDPQTSIRSTQVKGSMRRQSSSMTLSSEGDGTRMQYRLEVVPSLLASAAFSEERLKQEMTEQFTAIVAEMTRRKP